MIKNPLTYVFIVIGVLVLFYGNITPDLVLLHVGAAWVDMGDKALSAALIGVGLAMQHLGTPPPVIPGLPPVEPPAP